MNKILILVLLGSFSLRVSAQSAANFRLSGKITGRDTGLVVLTYWTSDNQAVSDTAQIENGTFYFTGYIDPADKAILAILTGHVTSPRLDDPNRTMVLIEPATMTISLREGDFADAVMTGSQAQKDMEEVRLEQMQVLDTIHSRDLRVLAARSIQYAFVAAHPNSAASPYLIRYYQADGVPADSAEKLYHGFTAEVKGSRYGREIAADIFRFHNHPTTPGSPAPDFVRPNIHGDTVRLSSFKGHSYVLLDFWFTACGHCRDLTPHLRELYAQYHKKGLEIISASDDTDRKKWLEAIHLDKMDAWQNINSYTPDEKNHLEVDYSIIGWPTLLLIDKDGVIRGRYEGTGGAVAELDHDLSKIFE